MGIKARAHRRFERERLDDAHALHGFLQRLEDARIAKSRRTSLRWHRRLRLAVNVSALLLGGLKAFARYFLSPDMFWSEATDTQMGSDSAS
jgi:hypothetical protein